MEYTSWVMRMDKGSSKKPRIQNNLRYYREKLGITGQEMEWRTRITKRHWSYYENGTHEPKVSLAQRMAAVFNDIAAQKEIKLKRLSVDDLYPPQ